MGINPWFVEQLVRTAEMMPCSQSRFITHLRFQIVPIQHVSTNLPKGNPKLKTLILHFDEHLCGAREFFLPGDNLKTNQGIKTIIHFIAS